MAFSDYISIFAITISALSLYLSWSQFSRDRSHLRLGLKIENDASKGPAFVISIVNVGRRSTTIARGYALVSSGKRFPVYDTPTVLEERKTLQFTVYFYDFFRSLSSGYFIEAFEVEDTAGKRYAVKTRPLRKKIEELLPSKKQLSAEE
jgi:hypothetical protein